MANNSGQWSEVSFVFKELTWKIPNFCVLRAGEDVTSPEFRVANTTWCLRLFVKAYNIQRYIDVHIEGLQSSVQERPIHFNIGLKSCYGKTCEMSSDEGIVCFNSQPRIAWSRSLHQIMDKEHLLLPNGVLTVFCQVRMKEVAREASSRPQQQRNEPSQTTLQETPSQTNVHESVSRVELQEASSQIEVEEASTSVQKLQSDYSQLLKSEEDSDVCLKVSDKEFRAHKCILRARSKVFSAMFKHETEEKASGEVVIDDLDADAFPDFLQHVYAGRVESLSSKNVSSLFFAADKYDLQELKSECREYMKRTLSVDTFCDVMILASRHREEELLRFAIDFFSKNLTKVIVTARWQTFSKDYNTEANELLIKALVPGGTND